ncbi:hypothetical protein TNCV_212631 [Trichonephila clavipes]|nr:hypothetical protein TNCV_212631 [Trichonephila clavipes]
MPRSGGQSEARSPVFKSPSKPGTHLSTHCSRDESLSQPCPARDGTRTCGGLSGRAVENRASTPQVWFLFPGWARLTQPFIPSAVGR